VPKSRVWPGVLKPAVGTVGLARSLRTSRGELRRSRSVREPTAAWTVIFLDGVAEPSRACLIRVAGWVQHDCRPWDSTGGFVYSRCVGSSRGFAGG
jgi:hypothetical protein